MFDFEKVRNTEFFRENRLDAHSDHTWYRSVEESKSGNTSFRYSLNGLWKFYYASNFKQVLHGFESVDYDCRDWVDIKVPGHIQLQGYDSPQYSNVAYPWDGREEVPYRQVPERFNPVAHYVKEFEVPSFMQGEKLCISFQGVESAIALWCNGEYVGYSEDSFTPSEFELTPYLKEGKNKLSALVFKWCGGSFCEDQDFFRFSGIFRDVYLYTVPQVHVENIRVRTLLAEDFESANLELQVKSTGVGSVRFMMRQGNKVVLEAKENLSKSENLYTYRVEKPRLWSAETPNLYELHIGVFDEKDQLQEIIPVKVGFRRFEIKEGLMLLNGKRIVFRGVDRHDFSAKTGRAISKEEILQDIVTMKRNNINAIRTSHYPNTSYLYELCDEYGIYMIGECNLESHASWEPIYRGGVDRDEIVPGDRPEWHEIMLDRATSMYERDKNHPAILIWSCGNEAFGGKNIYAMSCLFKEKDPTRIVQYEGIVHDRRYPETSDVESQMYTKVKDIKAFLKEHPEKPFICCEYMHAMGNSCGGMFKYTELADENGSKYQGGFIWDYIDQALFKKDHFGVEFLGYGGDFDDRPNDGNFSGDGICYAKDRKPSPKMQEVKFLYQNISVKVDKRSIGVWNKNLFVNTNQFAFVAMLHKEGVLLQEKTLDISVAPGFKKKFPMPFEIPEATGEYTITISIQLKEDTLWAKAGYEIGFGQGVFQVGDQAAFGVDVCKPGKLEVIRGTYNVGVKGDNFEVLFAGAGAGLISYRYAGKELIKTAPYTNFWRAPVDNDRGNHMMDSLGLWKLDSMYHTNYYMEGPVVDEKENTVSCTMGVRLPYHPDTPCKVHYTVYGDGTVKIEQSIGKAGEKLHMPEFGMLFRMDADYDQVTYYGNGPEECYADRDKGAKLGLYQYQAGENLSQYLRPQECGNRTRVRYTKVTDSLGKGFVVAGKDMNVSVLPYTPNELESALHPNELPPANYTVVKLSGGQMGVGGDDTWGAPVHEEFHVTSNGEMNFTWYLKGIC